MQNQLLKYFITTPIFYVNARPHIGHVYSVLLADTQCRFQKLKRNRPKSTLFTTGTDEHGLKIQQASEREKFANPKDFCDEISSEFKTTFDLFQVSTNDFVRTTEERHLKAVRHFWQDLSSKGYLQKTKYQSWYCVQDETFLTEHQIDKEKKISLESGHPVEWAEEENYVFPLENFRQSIQDWLKDTNVVQSKTFQGNILNLLENPCPDLSVSRASSRLKWGIPVPNDSTQTIYVWLDALVNYMTVCGYPDEMTNWPPDCHVIGKDILKFHAVYWPSFLLAAGLELPKQIFCHSHWTVNGEKMSKSKGNVVDPVQLAENLATFEGLRYFLLRQGVPHFDTNYERDFLISVLNTDLANTFGNLLNRVTAKSVNVDQMFHSDGDKLTSPEAASVLQCLDTLLDKVENHYSDFNFYLGLEEIMECLRRVNLLVQTEKPWELKKEGKLERLGAVLNLSLHSLRICAILLQPIVPAMSDTVLTKLNVTERTFDAATLDAIYKPSHAINPQKAMLFKKLV